MFEQFPYILAPEFLDLQGKQTRKIISPTGLITQTERIFCTPEFLKQSICKIFDERSKFKRMLVIRHKRENQSDHIIECCEIDSWSGNGTTINNVGVLMERSYFSIPLENIVEFQVLNQTSL